MTKGFRDSLNERLRDPEFHTEWDALEVEFQIAGVMSGEEETKSLTYKDPAKIVCANQIN